MKMAIIGGILLVIVLAVLFVVTGGLQSNEAEEVNGDGPVVVEPANTPPAPGNKNFNL